MTSSSKSKHKTTNKKLREKRQKIVFHSALWTTILISFSMIVIGALANKFLLWAECIILSSLLAFLPVFLYALIKKWRCVREEGLGSSHSKGHIDAKNSYKGSIATFISLLIIMTGLLIHIIVRFLNI